MQSGDSWANIVMPEPEAIAAYAASVADRLDFDPSLSQRVRQEIEDHLWECMAAGASNGLETVERATAQFGDPQALAAEFATIWLAEQTKKLSAAAVLIVLALLVMMKARLAWYGFAQWTVADEVRTLGSVVSLVDVCAFWLAVTFVVAGWAYLFGYRAGTSCAAQCRRFRHVIYLTSVSLLAVIVSVTCDVALTALRLVGREFSAQTLIPILSVVAETVLIGVFVLKIGSLATRMPRTTSLVEPDTLRRGAP
jgi:hypothetical protein